MRKPRANLRNARARVVLPEVLTRITFARHTMLQAVLYFVGDSSATPKKSRDLLSKDPAKHHFRSLISFYLAFYYILTAVT